METLTVGSTFTEARCSSDGCHKDAIRLQADGASMLSRNLIFR